MTKLVVGSDKKSSKHVISSITNKSSGISPPQWKEKKLVNDAKVSVDGTNPGGVAKVFLSPLSDKTIISWNSLPKKLQELGKVDCHQLLPVYVFHAYLVVFIIILRC